MINNTPFSQSIILYWIIIILVVINNSVIAEPRLVYIDPPQNSSFVQVQSDIVFSFNKEVQHALSPDEITMIVTGSKSGIVEGKIIKSNDGRRFIFKNKKNFEADEFVELSITTKEFSKHSFFRTTSIVAFDNSVLERVTHFNDLVENENTYSRSTNTRTINGISVPSDFPRIEVGISKETAPGKLFLNNWGGRPYIMILENDGTPYFYQRVEDRARDFKVQPTGTLTRRYLGNLNCFVELDSNYQIIDTLAAAAGYGTDEHEIQLLTNGNYLVIALDYQIVDMSQIVDGGNPNATVIGNSVQELDRDGNLLFNWRSWDHFNIADAVHENLTGESIDPVHMNAIAVDYDGHLLISSRNQSEVTKINRNTGEVIWRFGGVNNEFNLVNDQHGISYQHDIRPVPGLPNRYTLMDNGNHHNPPFSRAFEFEVDTTNMTAEKVWEYRHSPDRYTWWMGNVQRLPNGNTLINYADAPLPKATEVTPEGEIIYEMNFASPVPCYRTFRFDWKSIVEKPYLIVEPLPDKVILIFNKFGDKSVDYYNIYGGDSKYSQTFIDSTQNTWLELTDLPDDTQYYFRVTAVDSSGNESEFSNEVDVYIDFNNPGENLVHNGDFSEGNSGWNFATYGGAQAIGSEYNGEYRIQITEGGDEIWHVQLTQNNIGLINGYRYKFEFDARSTDIKIIDGKLEKNGPPYTNYGKINSVLVEPTEKTFQFEFEMEDVTDYNARVVFNCGISNDSLFIDNVKLTRIIVDNVDDDKTEIPKKFKVFNNYPNPFNPSTTIKYSIPVKSQVKLKVYDALGREILTLVDKTKPEGSYVVEFNGSTLPSGVYFYRFSTANFTKTHKMLLIK